MKFIGVRCHFSKILSSNFSLKGDFKMKEKEIKKVVREGYAKIAKQNTSCCAPSPTCCSNVNQAENICKSIGYTDEEIKAVPQDANLGLGCGNPVALASLREGETVLDLGSGAGFDCFLAAVKVGDKGKVIGVDMTPEMIEKARNNAKKGNYKNVEFRLGEIENLPVADNSIDAIISNCVINLSPDKRKVFKEAFRVLKPGGRIMVSDLVLQKELPDIIKNSIGSYIGCLSGAIMKNQYLGHIKEAGFQRIEILQEKYFPIADMANDPTAKAVINNLNSQCDKTKEIENYVLSINVSALKSVK